MPEFNHIKQVHCGTEQVKAMENIDSNENEWVVVIHPFTKEPIVILNKKYNTSKSIDECLWVE